MSLKDKYPITKPRKFEFTKEEKKNAKLKELKPFIKYYSRFKGYLIIISIFLLLLGAISIISPIVTGKMIAQFTADFNANLILNLALISLVLALISHLLNFIMHKFWCLVSINSVFYITKDLTIRINEITQSSFDSAGTGVFTTRMFSDVSTVGRVPLQIINYISESLSQVGFLTYTFALNIWVGLFMIGYTILAIALEYYRINTRQKHNKVIRKVSERANSFINENIRGMKDIRSVNATNSVLETGFEIAQEKSEYEYSSNLILNRISRGRGAILSVLSFAFIALCVYLLVNGQIELAAFIIAYNYRGRIMGFANYIITIKNYLSDCTLAAQRLNEIFDETKYPIEKFGDVNLEHVEGYLEFNNVSFGYVDDVNILNNLSLKFEKNKVTSLVGLSGAGKSTIVSLISRLYDIKDGDGEILLDDVNIKELTKDCLRQNICYISQNPYIYNMSIEENLRLAKKDATQEELVNALTKANIYNDVMQLKDGLNSILGENGIKLSGGQRQRIAIARAVLRDSKVLLFDEATSALDNKNQSVIKNTIKDLAKDHTVIVIAHRLSTVVDSDKIIFIKDGDAYAQGTHMHLMETCEEYYSLYKEEEVK